MKEDAGVGSGAAALLLTGLRPELLVSVSHVLLCWFCQRGAEVVVFLWFLLQGCEQSRSVLLA